MAYGDNALPDLSGGSGTTDFSSPNPLPLQSGAGTPPTARGPMSPPIATRDWLRANVAQPESGGRNDVAYGGATFQPTQSFPTLPGKAGPAGISHAAGLYQWQPDTWSTENKRLGGGLKFSSLDDQDAAAYSLARRTYFKNTGGRDLDVDVSKGRVDKSALSGVWSSLGVPRSGSTAPAGYGDNPVSNDQFKVSDRAIAEAQDEPDTTVVWMKPSDYLDLAGPAPAAGSDTGIGSRFHKLARSIQRVGMSDLPSLDVKDGKVIDQDGRQRALAAQQAQLGYFPVRVAGIGNGKTIIGQAGVTARPFDFALVPQDPRAGQAGRNRAAFGRGVENVGLGATQLAERVGLGPAIAGAARLAGRVLPESLSPSAAWSDPGRIGDATEQALAANRAASAADAADPNRSAPGTESMGNAVATAPILGQLGRFGLKGLIGGGALAGASTPVADPNSGFWGEKGAQTVFGAATGGLFGSLAGRVAPSEAAPASDAAIREAALAHEVLARGIPLDQSQSGLVPAGIVSRSAASIAAGQAASREAWQRQVVRTIGQDAPIASPGVMSAARRRIGSTFDTIEARTPVAIHSGTISDLAHIETDAHDSLTDTEYRTVKRLLNNVIQHTTPEDRKAGTTFAQLLHSGSELDRAVKSPNRNVGFYASQIKEVVIDAMQRSMTPEDAQAYGLARRQWKNLKTIEPIVSRSGGDIDPAALNAAVSRKNVGRAYDVNSPDLDRLARIGQKFMTGGGEATPAATGRSSAGPFIGSVLGSYALGPLGAVAGGVLGHSHLGSMVGDVAKGAALGIARKIGLDRQPELLPILNSILAPKSRGIMQTQLERALSGILALGGKVAPYPATRYGSDMIFGGDPAAGQ